VYGGRQGEWSKWHTLEVGEPFVENGKTYPQYTWKHDKECPREVDSVTFDGVNYYRVDFRCYLGYIEESGAENLLGDWVTTPGLYRVRARTVWDYWGEADEDIEVAILHGPVDAREFDEPLKDE
jgi:hypothetical protein